MTTAFFLALFSVLPANTLQSQTFDNQPMAIFEQVVPNAYAAANGTASFLGPYSASPRTYQMLIASSELTNLVGKNLTSISFRSLASATSSWPASDVVFTSFDIYLSGSVAPADRSFTFANNIVGAQTQVRSGSLTIPANSLTFGASPNAFSYDINFSSPWLYSGGNLLIEIRHTGFTGTARSVDAIGTSTSGYATLFSACWAGNYTATSTTSQGNFCVVNIKGNDGLGLADFDLMDYAVYPNPTRGELYVEGNLPMRKLSLYNMLGQKVMEESAGSPSESIDLSGLVSGAYVLRIETEAGTSSRKIIRE